MIAGAVAVGLAACALLAVRALREGPRAWVAWLERGVGDGAVVLGGLGVQGWGVPAARWLWVAALSGASLPGFAAPAWVGAALVLVVTDAAWWWQHRWLHGRGWALHAVHHEASAMDVWCASRGTWWASLGFVYLWVDGLWLALLEDDRGVLFGVSVHAALDLWRHSGLDLPKPVSAALRGWIIRPCDHARHHDARAEAVNLGANWALWDVWAGTFRPGDSDVAQGMGRPTGLTPWRAALWPWGAR
jgi:sterol desaturase/sphingolipid hydroxylase (fatty acid hydroxylase superfamily)